MRLVEKFKIAVMIFLIIFLFRYCLSQYNYIQYYDCIDYKGEQVICYRIDKYKSELMGQTEDGTWVKLNSYKYVMIKEEE